MGNKTVDTVHGMAGRQVNVKQSRLDNGFVVLELQNAKGEHCGSVVLTPKGTKQLSDILEKHAQQALAIGMVQEMAVLA